MNDQLKPEDVEWALSACSKGSGSSTCTVIARVSPISTSETTRRADVILAQAYCKSQERELRHDAKSFCAGGCQIEPPPLEFCRHVKARRKLEARAQPICAGKLKL